MENGQVTGHRRVGFADTNVRIFELWNYSIMLDTRDKVVDKLCAYISTTCV